MPPIRTQTAYSSSSSSSTNTSNCIPSTSTGRRSAPGARGPAPSSCEWCRRLRAKCVRPSGGRGGEEDCLACLKKGIECKVPQEITRRAPPVLKAEEGIVTTQLSIARGTGLFELYFDDSRVGVETNFIPLCFHDPLKTQARFEAVGRKLESLESHEQLRCRLIWAAAAKRWLTSDQTTIESAAKSVQLLKSAQDLADASAVWRTPTLANYTSLLLLYFVTAFGDLGNEESQYYLISACAQFRQLFRTPEPLFNFEGRAEWAAWSSAIVDTGRALDTGTAPFLSAQDFSIFSPTNSIPDYLPDPSFLASFLPNHALQLIDQLTHAVTFYLYTGRAVATHFAKPYPATVQEDFKTLQAAWNRLDTLASWIGDCAKLFWAENLVESYGLTALRSSLIISWMSSLLIEFTILRYLDRRLSNLSESHADFPNDSTSSVNFSSLASLQSVADLRCKRALCVFLRHTRNRDGVYFLSAASGYQCSVDRLNGLATSLANAQVENYDLFPTGAPDKLSSVTFFLKTLENTQQIYQTARLGNSITSLTTIRATLEAEIGCTGEAALALFTTSPPSSGFISAVGPGSVMTQAATFVHKGTL